MTQAKHTQPEKRFLNTQQVIVALAAILLPATTLAHPGHENVMTHNGLYMGLIHPFSGLDHLLAMLSVGLWVALTMTTRPQQASTFIAFLAAMLLGGVLSLQGATLQAVEPLILLSLLAFGLLVATAARLPSWIALGITALFALFHGFAHGHEIPAQTQAVGYVGGFLIGTLALLGGGAVAGKALHLHANWAIRTSGAAVAAYGLTLLGLT